MNSALVLDANNLIIRNVMASALDDLKANGRFTGGIYGTIRSIRLLVSLPDVQYDRVYAFFDSGVSPRRLRLLPGYKQARKERKELLPEVEKERAFQQVEECFTLLPLLGVRCLAFKDREADDGVAAAVRILVQLGHDPVVVSSDKDLLQTVAMGATVLDPLHGRTITAENFEQEIGLPPSLFVLYRTLVGDQSDSIEGVRGCGPKRALQAIQGLCKHYDGQLPPHPRDRTPFEQIDDLVAYLRVTWAGGAESRAWERTALTSLARLRRIVQGIDLRTSWGPEEGLARAMAEPPPKLDAMGFLRACKKLQMGSVLGDPEGYLRPFRKVQARWLGGQAKTRV